MRLLVHRGQVLLLLVVGVLAGVAVAGVCLEMDGISVFGGFSVEELFAPPRSQLPSRIVIGGAHTQANDSALAGSAAAAAAPGVAPAVAQPASPRAVQTAPTPAVVPGAVYAWPTPTPEDGGGHGGGGRSGRGS
jgi:hypothetical protein